MNDGFDIVTVYSDQKAVGQFFQTVKIHGKKNITTGQNKLDLSLG